MFPRLQGEEAIETLQYFIKKLEKSNKNLTKNQTNSLKRVAKGLIASIETEMVGTLQIKAGIAN